jgi:hypothetical protein
LSQGEMSSEGTTILACEPRRIARIVWPSLAYT